MTKVNDAAQISILPPFTMSIEEARRTQRALRRLKPDPVDEALVLRLVALALKAGMGRNAQNWEFVLVKDRAVKARLARLYRIAWGLYGQIGRRLTASDPKMPRQLAAVQWQAEHFEEIPVLVVGVPARHTAGVATCCRHQLLWNDLPFGAKSAAGGTGGRSGRSVDHAPPLEHLWRRSIRHALIAPGRPFSTTNEAKVAR
jgi:nitroreductase